MMKTLQPSIRDIAKALGVSASTVSRALKNHPDISKDTCQKVQEYAERVHYRPNVLALGLKSQRSQTIGVIVPEIVHHFFSTLISGIEDLAYGKGYRVMICQSNEDYLREVINVQALNDHRVDGLLVSISKSTLDANHFIRVIQNEVPIVFMDRICHDIQSDRVVTNDFEGAKMVVSHMLQRGRRRILHLAGPKHLTVGVERNNGYRQALVDHHIAVDEDLILHCDTPQRVETRRSQILAMANEIDGIFAVNDFTAVASMRLLQDAGYNIPADIAIAGFGDDPIADMVSPSLTTVKQRGYDMGREAAALLISRLQGIQPERFQTKVFPAMLKVRNSA